MREIPLTKGGFVALVDDEDYDWLASYRWYPHSNGNGGTIYAARTARGGALRMHRQILRAPRKVLVDHRDGNGLNNQRSNIRLCTARQNRMNGGPHRKRAEIHSRYRGVCWVPSRGKWRVEIACQYLGLFETEVDAALAYDAAARRLFGEFARPNLPEPGPR